MTKKVRITENQIKRYLLESEDFDETEAKTKIMSLINTGNKENIELAFSIAEGIGLPIEEWIVESNLGLLINWLSKYISLRGSTIKKKIVNLFETDEIYIKSKNLGKLPNGFEMLTNLKKLTLFRCGLKYIPSQIYSLTNLIFLNLNANKIKYIPKDISKLNNLNELYLFHNEIPEQNKIEVQSWLPNTKIEF